MHPDSKELIPIVGAPNAGKTTVFNLFTGINHGVVNYPGSTVTSLKSKALHKFGSNITFVDTPGIYSLAPQSPDEKITIDIINKTRKVLLVIDVNFLESRLTLLEELLKNRYSVVVLLTHIDRAKFNINPKILSAHYKTPFIEKDSNLFLQAIIYAFQNLSSSTINSTTPPTIEWKTKSSPSKDLTNSIDKFLLKSFASYIFLALIMMGIFSCVFFLARYPMELIELIFGALSTQLKLWFKHQELLGKFLSDGLVEGLGALFIFTPQIFVLFLAIYFIEASGYMARATILLDKPLSKFGLSGKSFVSLVSGFACAVPAVLSVRSLSSYKHRLLTTLTLPFALCSAKLPMYGVLLNFLFFNEPSWKIGISFALLYVLSIFIGIFVSGILNKVILKNEPETMLMLELPKYKLPKLTEAFYSASIKTYNFIKSAGPIILSFSIGLWFLTTFPNYNVSTQQEKISTSYASTIGKTLNPLFASMGTDWRVGISILSSFVAREIFVPSLAVALNLSEDDGENILEHKSLILKMHTAKKNDGEKLFTFASVFSLLIFVIVAFQCTSTYVVMRKELGRQKYVLLQFVLMNAMAYLLAIGMYKLLS